MLCLAMVHEGITDWTEEIPDSPDALAAANQQGVTRINQEECIFLILFLFF